MKMLGTIGGAVVGGVPGALLGLKLAGKKKPAAAPVFAPPPPRLDPGFGQLPAAPAL